MRILSFTFIIAVGFLMTNCAFNKRFYKPDTASVKPLPDTESIYIPYAKSDSIHAILYEHEDPIASVFFLHGNAGNLSSWYAVGELFYQKGYTVFMLDYPGFGNSSGTATHANVIESTYAAVDYFKKHKAVSSTKKLIGGFSLGGNLAIKVAVDHPLVFDGLFVEGAFSSHKDIAASGFPKLFRFLPRLLVKNSIDAASLISVWDKPLMVVHSSEDRTCPIEQGRKIYASAVSTQHKDFWEIKGPHLGGISRQPELYFYRIKQLLDY